MGTMRWRPGWVQRCAVIAVVVALGVMTAGWTATSVERAADQGALGVDFAISVWIPGRDVARGESPLRTYSGDEHDGGSVYPPIAAIVTFPFSIPSYELARALWWIALLGCLLGGLWLCGLRDWRCYAFACASPPVVAGLLYANLSIALVLAVALVWRYRDRALIAGLVIGLVVAMKLFLWPVVLWLAITRRWAGLGNRGGHGGDRQPRGLVGRRLLGAPGVSPVDGEARFPEQRRRHVRGRPRGAGRLAGKPPAGARRGNRGPRGGVGSSPRRSGLVHLGGDRGGAGVADGLVALLRASPGPARRRCPALELRLVHAVRALSALGRRGRRDRVLALHRASRHERWARASGAGTASRWPRSVGASATWWPSCAAPGARTVIAVDDSARD